MRSRLWSPAVAIAFAVLSAAVVAAAFPLLSLSHQWSGATAATLPGGVACLVLGLLLSIKRPENVMGWCLLGISLFFGLNAAASGYDVLDYRLHAGTLPGGWIAVLLQPSWAPAILLMVLTVLLFPDGRLSSRASRWMAYLLLAVGVAWFAGAFGISLQTVADHAVRVDSVGTLLAIDKPRGAWAWWGVVQVVFFVVVAVGWVVWLVQVVLRYRRAARDEQLQLKWLISGATVCLICGGLALTSSSASTALQVISRIADVGLVALPVCLAVAVMKFRLYDVDRLVSRTVSYLVVSGVVVGAYVGLVALTSKTIGFSSPVAVATSTLVAAALFNPVRKRVQRVVDRRFNRARYDAERMVVSFAGRLRDEVDPEAVRWHLEQALRTSLEPAVVSVWINPARQAE